jgi:glycosyltransferase involved in cell wall biosynthesis
MEGNSNVSIIMCAYNAEHYIQEAIESVLAQTYTGWELIVVDDGSVDETAHVVQRFTSDTRIRYAYQENKKQGAARNLALSMAKGEWIAILDADDRWHPKKLEMQLAAIREYQADVYCSKVNFIDSSGSVMDFSSQVQIQVGYLQNELPLLNGRNDVVFSTVLMRKALLVSIGGFDETPGIAEDYNLFLKMTDNGCIFYRQDQVLANYRIHNSQTSLTEFITFMLSVNAFKNVSFQRLRNVAVPAMKKRLNRFLIHNIEIMDKNQVNKLLFFYANYPGLRLEALMHRFALLPGVNFYKKWAYRYVDVKPIDCI